MTRSENSDIERANELYRKALSDSSEPSVSELRNLLDSPDATVREVATNALGLVAARSPGKAKPAAEDLHSLLSDDERSVRANAFSALGWIATEYPEVSTPAVDDIRSLLFDDNDMVRLSTAGALKNIAKKCPEDVKPVVDDLNPLLFNERNDIRTKAARTLGYVAEKYPEEVKIADIDFRSLLSDDHDKLRRNAAIILCQIAKENPEEVKPVAGDLCSLLSDEYKSARKVAAEAIVPVAEEYPKEIKPAIGDLRSLLFHDFTDVHAADALESVASEYPKDVTPALQTLQSYISNDPDIISGDRNKGIEKAAKTVGKVAMECPEVTKPEVDKLRSCLSDGSVTEIRDTIRGLAYIASVHSELANLILEDFCTIFSDDNETLRKEVSLALGYLSKEIPNETKIITEDLGPILSDENKTVRAEASHALGSIASEFPQEIKPVVNEIRPLLSDEHEPVRVNAAYILGEIAIEYPLEVVPAVHEIKSCLSDDNQYARKHATHALGGVATEYPETVEPAINDIGELLNDEAVAVVEEATETLSTLNSTYPDQVQEVVEMHAPKRVSEITGETTAVSTENERATKTYSIPETIPTVERISLGYGDTEKGDPIGQGGNADVYHATAETDRGKVELALKQPRMKGTLHSEAIDRLLEEAETWQQLDDHEHIVTVVDYGSGPLPWIAMEYMDGGHLGERIGEMDVEQALWTAIATTKAVRHAHRRGIAHLDLKPENVLFCSCADSWDIPKVADWGLSKQLLDHSTGVDGISPQYAAPEQVTDDFGPADEITDIYQLGTIFYALFTGRHPFEGQPSEIIHQIQHADPTPPSDVADLPASLDDILLQALATEKTERYETVVNLRNDLQDVFEII